MNKLLNEAQQDYFKNSKVRDKDGNLLVAYHGSGTKIETFDPSFTGKGADQYGSGFYFTTEKNFADAYTKIRNTDNSGRERQKLGGEDQPAVVKAYLNIENPIICDDFEQPNLSNVLIPNNIVYDIVRKLPTLYHTVQNEDEPNPLSDYSEKFWDVNPQTPQEFEPLIKEMVKTHFQDTDLKMLDLLFGKYGTELRNAIHDTLGFDGVIVNFKDNQHFVAWFPEQIKDVDNLYPQHTNKLMDDKPLTMANEYLDKLKNKLNQDDKGEVLIYGYNDKENSMECVVEGKMVMDGETVIVARTNDGSLIQGIQDLFQKPQEEVTDLSDNEFDMELEKDGYEMQM